MLFRLLSLACLLGHSIMPAQASVDKCQVGYDYFENGNTCIKLFDGYFDWKSRAMARDLCQAQGGDVVVIDNEDLQTYITGKLKKYTQYWIGVENKNPDGFDFYYINGEPMTYSNWLPGQPNNAYDKKDLCVFIFGNSEGTWADYNCMSRLPFICQQPAKSECKDGYSIYEPEGSCIQVRTDRSSWNQAQENCQADGGDLVTIQSEGKNNFVIAMLNSRNFFWIGAKNYEEKGAIDVRYGDGTPVSYTNWNRGQPDNYQGKELCVMVFGALHPNRGKWNDYGCDKQIQYVCEISNDSK